MSIHYLKNKDIDFKKWDRCISKSFNGELYAYSWYLNIICETWDALVEDDYKAVMPLITRRFIGNDIITMPVFINDLGIYSGSPINSHKTGEFVAAIPSKFRYYKILLNKFNPYEDNSIRRNFHTRHELDLIKPYHKLVSDFSPGLRRNLNIAMARNQSFIKGLTLSDYIMLHEEDKSIEPAIRSKNYKLLRTIVTTILRYRTGELYGVYNEHNMLVSAALFAWTNNKMILLNQTVSASFINDFPHLFLIDRFIDKYAETNTILSFDYYNSLFVPNVYGDFGASPSNSLELTKNRLPFYLKPFIKD